MSFRPLGLFSHSCYHLLITLFVLFYYHHIFILFLVFIMICFTLSLLFLGLMIIHILVQRGQSYHSIHPIIWHWFGDFSLRGCLMGRGSCIHQWFERVCSFLTSFPLEFDLLIIRACTFKKTKQNKTKQKQKRKKKHNDMFVYGILLHWELMSHFEVCLLGIFVIVGFCEIFIWVFTHWATLVMHLECRGFMWEFYEILCFLDHGWYVLGMRDE